MCFGLLGAYTWVLYRVFMSNPYFSLLALAVYRVIYITTRDQPWRYESPWLRGLSVWAIPQWYFGGLKMYANPSTALSGPLIFASFPHGMMSASTVFRHMAHGKQQRNMDNVTVSPWFFRIPLLRELVMLAGGIPHDNRIIKGALADNRRVLVSPEGVMGIVAGQSQKLDMHLHENTTTYRRRDGIFHLAKLLDVPVVVLYTHNEHAVTCGTTVFNKLQRWLIHKAGLCSPCFFLGPIPAVVTIYSSPPIMPSEISITAFKDEIYRSLCGLVVVHTSPKNLSANMINWLKHMQTSHFGGQQKKKRG